MLRALEIRDVLLIDQLDIEFRPGLNVLTGETGAGKSILLDALGFVLGWRGRADIVRTGAVRGEVVACFELEEDHPARPILEEAGLSTDGDELILRRVNSPDGRKTAWVNDRRCSGEVLRALSDKLVELHGQNDDRGLLDPRGHRAMLDAFAGHEKLLERTRAAWRELRAAQTALDAEQTAQEQLRADEEALRAWVAELHELDPEPGEDVRLDERKQLMRHAVDTRETLTKALEALEGGTSTGESVESRVFSAINWLGDVVDQMPDQVRPAIAALERALTEMGEAQTEMTSCIQAMQFSPGELEIVDDRLSALRSAARKHRVQPDELPELTENLTARLARIDGSSALLTQLATSLDQAQADYSKASAALSTSRNKAARRLDTAMSKELQPLRLERAKFQTHVGEGTAGPQGADDVTFQVATNPGAPPGPLNQVASGGELSRFLLALKVCLTRGARGLTLIFDEIDRGVGGATADAVGRRLFSLSATPGSQVLVVTHSPQVASKARHHWRVSKTSAKEITTTHVEPLDDNARRDEIARMLAGDQITKEARAAAEALLKG